MLPFWLLLVFLGPVIGCVAFVLLTTAPSPLTAVTGAVVGMVVSLFIVFLFA